MVPKTKKNVAVFNDDIKTYGGYYYTQTDRLSTQLSVQRMSHGMAEINDWKGKTVLDLGCGDGEFTVQLAELGAKHVVGIDLAPQAIEMANNTAAKLKKYNLSYRVDNIYKMDSSNVMYDVIVLRGVLHHLPDPALAVSIAAKLGKEIVILEPNGMNPIVKIIERFSSYHIKHEEQSFLFRSLRSWVHAAGAKIVEHRFINLVPTFCPDRMARFLKVLEPLVEKLPLVRALSCAQVVLR